MSLPRILVLDDEMLIRWSLDQILTKEGYEVDAAATPEEALQLIGTKAYGLVLADLEICGERARAFFAGLRVGRDDVRIIILTALALDLAEVRLGDFRADRIMEKPFASEEILAAVQGALTGTRKDHDA